MTHLKSVKLKSTISNSEVYPYNLPFLQQFEELTFKSPVTILVGENGTGKSTLLEAIAVHADSILIGGEVSEKELSDKLANQLKLIWTVKTRAGFYFRANEFNHFINRLRDVKEESLAIIAEIKREGRNEREIDPHANTLTALKRLYGDGLEYRSHGESFLDLFHARFQPNGLYILDEPEAPLSPAKQLTLISMMKEMVEANCQFIIATHSPILMSYPGADLYVIEDGNMKRKAYDDLEHVHLTRDFLNHPERFLRHL